MNYFKGRALSFSSWFSVPEQGMVDIEILCRASAFLVKAKSKSFSHKYHVLTVSHAVAPWKWPKYYPDDWLQHVNEKHTYYTTEMRNPDGSFVNQIDLLPQAYHHSKRDLAVLHIEHEDIVLKNYDPFGIKEVFHYPSEKGDIQLTPNMRLKFHGHKVGGQDSFASPVGGDTRKAVPMDAAGTVTQISPHQVFAGTRPVLMDGMCGGPVVFEGDSVGAWARGEAEVEVDPRQGALVGLLEGIVPGDHSCLEIRSNAVFVEAREIMEFLDQIEAGLVQPLVGGEVIDSVGSDQDPDKMDMNKFL